jgi:hypothetical protein
MKTYKEYLAESEKKYGFRVKLAQELTDDQMESLQRELTRWNMEAISEPKRLPIAEVQPGFAHLKNTEMYMIDLVVNYPCTPAEIQAAVHESTQIPLSHILVMTPQQEVLAAPIVPESEQALLTSDYPEPKQPQLLQDLAKALKNQKTYEYQFAVKDRNTDKVFQGKKGTTTNQLKQGNISPVGTKKNKLPLPSGRI